MNQVVIHDAQNKQWLKFSQPIAVVRTNKITEVLPCLEEVNRLVQQQLWGAGFLSYEAASAFDSVLLTHQPTDFPLLWFGLYSSPEIITLPTAKEEFALRWQPTITKEKYNAAIAKIKQYISNGDTYQVNYTTRLEAEFAGDTWQYFLRLIEAQQADYGAYIELEKHTICSASPELFFTLDGQKIVSRPMKGTSARGYTLRGDRNRAKWLQNSAKNQAENVMIVDMIRNDLARIARLGTVNVPNLFQVEQYPTLWQMTSTVEAETDASLPQIMEALFPCASITGAPKPSTMKIIRELEPSSRGIYTGTIGYLSPQNQAQFNVAIRTVAINKEASQAEYGVGGGIVWDSASASEYEECQIKARVLLSKVQQFDLLETILWNETEGYFLLDHHLQRISDSAAYFKYPLDIPQIKEKLVKTAANFQLPAYKVRLLVSKQEEIKIEATSQASYPKTVKLAIAKEPIDTNDPFIYHKTTNRQVYQRFKQAFPHCDDVILWNEKGEVTETCIYNIVIEKAGRLITPRVESGLLSGTFRAFLLEQQKIEEATVTLEDLHQSDRIYVINSVRKWQQGIIQD